MPWFGRKKEEQVARKLYEAIVARAREPVFYRDLGVPDTLDGRFEMIALHLWLVLRRLRAGEGTCDKVAGEGLAGEGGAGRSGAEPLTDVAQSLFDLFMLDMDQSLRELGAGDLGVGKRVKRMATAFYGRLKAYGVALEPAADERGEGLEPALRRNLYGTVTPPAGGPVAVADYVRAQAGHLAACADAALARGEMSFGALPEPATAPEQG